MGLVGGPMLGGIDEAGRGPVFGPMVVAGVSGPDQKCFRSLGVKDSKLLTPVRREELRVALDGVCSRIQTVVIPADEIDRRRKRETMNEIEVVAFAEIGRALEVEELFLDAADVDADRFGRLVMRRLGKLRSTTRIVSKHKADVLHPCVSAASIVAKVLRDSELRKMAAPLEARLGLPLGSGYTHDPITITFLEKWFDAYGRMPTGTRRTWATAKEIRSRAGSRLLDEFVTDARAVPRASA